VIITKTISQIRAEIKKSSGKKIALVPTMGALHEGHLVLVKKAANLAEIVVVSIFVNKAQFNDLSDYQNYPKQIKSDLRLLKKSGATHVFLPQNSEIFGQNFSFKLIPTNLVDCLCGKSRLGHFDGVSLIVAKLFNIIKPNIAVFGQKDFQQVAVIKKLVKDLNFDIKIHTQKTVRNESGLAMSSRNQRLSETSKIKAASIFKFLNEIKSEVKKNPQNLMEILQKKRQKFLEIGFEKVDYLEIRQEKNLELLKSFDEKISSRIFIAAYLEKVRLIDNIRL
jgi:pantoate--beta-alanine ligase